ncbi:hypothetical protein G7Z17_g6534 [Cylindrodendrum hubeiense]|uniref:Diaminohydroxyphosphoribosylamino-pyrimidine deaminase n=1 Tax=Cylindrodendrum hubeiense TaxID=595255 RepID=A0A9P5HC43_9HYPO|nr:hypothetical protein G7Z17_g6534 [Cylindrodendrum hubeiense]
MSWFEELMGHLEPEIEDPEEETFILYSRPLPSLDLGFIDPRASVIDVSVAGHDFTIHQSPSVLSSNRAGGTTGAVLWKITPAFASWLASPSNQLFTPGSLGALSSASILELGCGISPLSALGLAPRVARYVLTDQPYVQRLLQRNLDENLPSVASSSSHGSGTRARGKKRGGAAAHEPHVNVRFVTLDWETDEVTPSLIGSDQARSFDAVVACDCVYNYALVAPFVQTCVDACRLRIEDSTEDRPCLCVIGQQLRNDEVFESWLKTFQASFRVWRVPDTALPEELRSTAGFVVHVGVLRDAVPSA